MPTPQASGSSPRKSGPGKNGAGVPRLSRTKRPPQLSLDDWQRGLREQFGREQEFQLRNVGDHPVCSEFLVHNPKSRRTYRVAIRGTQPGHNFCSCPDFATNALGTCKHVAFTLALLERKRGGRTALKTGWRPAYSEVYLEYGARRRVRFQPGTDCPAELRSLAASFFDADGVLTDAGLTKFDEFLQQAGEADHDLRCYEDALGYIAGVRDAAARRERIAAAFPAGPRSAKFKTLLKAPLYDYQRQGALFLAQAGRGILGDEMGLGKTIQALAATEILAESAGVERVLIVCPTSLKHQWDREIARFTARDVRVIGGNRAAREESFRVPAFFHITNYDTIRADLDLIAELEPDLVILDEAQRIKNWETQTARSVKRIRSPHAIVLTGTPIENRLEELVSIVQFVDQHRLGPTYRFLHEHQIRDEPTGRVVGYQHLDEVGRTLEPILIRRRKGEVLEQLPERIDSNVFVPMTPQQRKHHDENRDAVARIVHKWRQFGFLTEQDQRRLMICLQNMRMSCNSTYLLDHQTDHSHKPDELGTLVAELCEQPEAKVVVFSQWLRTHELIVRRLAKRDLGHVLFHGGVESSKRKELVDRFREDDACRLFLSTDAGGVGLNLQHAAYVVNMDLPWNPAVLEQRIGRVHRLGQQQTVRVVNFVAQGTIEDAMREVLSFKQSLFDGVLDGGSKEVFLGKSRLAQFMETVESVTSVIPPAPAGEPSDDAPPTDRRAPRKGLRARRRNERSSSDAADPGAAVADDAWQTLCTVGAAFLQALGEQGKSAGQHASRALRLPLERDAATGREFLRIPVPNQDALDQLIHAAATLLERMR